MRFFERTVASLITVAFVFASLALMFSPAYSQEQSSSAGLTEAEQWSVLRGAMATGVANGATSLTEAQALRQEVLLIEMVPEFVQQQRAGKAYIYDYTTNTLNVVTVNLETGQAVLLETQIGNQLPLTMEEIDRAIQIGIGNDAILAEAEVAYEQSTGESLTNLEQLTIGAQIFVAASAPALVNMQSADCGVHRCAILSMQTRQGAVIPVQPIIDLSTQLVIQNITDPLAIVAEPGNLGFVDTGQITDGQTLPEFQSADAINSGGAMGASNGGQSSTFMDESGAPSRNQVIGQVSAAPSQQLSQDLEAEAQTIVATVESVDTPGSAKTDIFIPIVARRNIKKLPQQNQPEPTIFMQWWCGAVQNSPLFDEIQQLCRSS